MNDIELLHRKLREYKESLQEEMRKISLDGNEQIKELQSRLEEIAEEERLIKVKIREIKESSKHNQPGMLALARKMKAIDQILP